MSDYLNSLVARTLQLEPVVQPRLASLFEPLSAAAGFEAAALKLDSLGEDSMSSESAFGASETRLPKQQTLPATVDVPINEKETNAPSAISNPATNAFLQPSPTLFPTQAIPQSTSFAPNPNILDIADEPLTPQPSNTASANSSSDTDNYQTRRRINPEVRRSSAEPDRQRSLTTSDVPSIVTYTGPPAPRSLTRSVNAQAPVPPAQPETVVVTIGRVDVRAIFTPPTAAPRSNRFQQPQPMSLDEYLKRRSEGHR